ncbi:hypothetical protein SKAU_G00182720 [Synaphobranchus kaupii]|uniref:C2H2-type domain-containing protein n=1 Tax=Synaphobranchus kaupii TaxID=118154 RepID=A0A9Q1IWF6_SYNKA|nr:hypothetical protein SKAU_G00182720 [Synaphobranchus kaupii]
MDSSDYTGVEPRSGLNRCEDIEDRREEKARYFMGREQKDILTNMKKEEDGERQSVKMEGEDGVRDEEKLWKKEEKQREGYVNDQVAQTDTLVNNGVISEHRQQEVQELSSLITSCLHKQPRVLIRRLEVDSRSVPVSLPPCIMACKRGQGVRSPWRQHELLSLGGNGSLRQKKGQVMTRKRKTNGQLERPLKMLPSSLENRICAEASLISPVISPRNRNTGKTVEVSSQVFACSQCQFVHTEEVNLHQHIETVHPEELNTTVCLPSVYYPDQLKTLLRHHRSLGQLDMNGTLPSIEECKLSSMSRPPSQSMMDYTKLTNTDSQSESITDCLKCSSPTSSGEDIKVEPVMDSSDYTGVEPRSTDVNRCEDIERTERKTGYFMSREQKDILTNMKEEKEDWERQSVKMEGEDGVRDEEGLWKKEEKETDEQREGYVNDQVAQTDKLVKNGVISEHGQQEGEDLWSTLVTACLQKQPRVLIRRLEIANSSVPVSSSPHTMTYKRDLGARSPWRQHELLSLRRNRSLRQKKRQVMTRKRKTKGQLERSPKMLPSENGICAEASLISPVIFPRNQNTGQTVELVSQVFGCSQCPFIDTEEVNLNQHIEKVHPEELNTTSVYCPDQLKTLFRHHRSLGQLDMNATLPSMEECKLSSTSRPPSQTMMDSTKLTNTDSQSESITDCLKCSSPTSSGEDIKVEPVMDSSDYTRVEPVNRCEDIEERTERKTGYFMSREQTDILTNMKEEKEDWERQSVKMEGEDEIWERDLHGDSDELLSLRRNGSLRQKKGQVMTRKRKSNGQLERSLKMLPSENGICAEASLISPAFSPRNRNTGSDHTGTLPSIEECKLSSMSRPPSQRVVDSTKLTNTNSQSESITDCLNCLSPASAGEDIKVEPVMDSSDYTGVEPRSGLNRCEDIEERREEKTGYFMGREQKDILTNMKKEGRWGRGV